MLLLPCSALLNPAIKLFIILAKLSTSKIISKLSKQNRLISQAVIGYSTIDIEGFETLTSLLLIPEIIATTYKWFIGFGMHRVGKPDGRGLGLFPADKES